MSFLDNLENNLKALEGNEAGGTDDRRKRDLDRKRAIAAAPWADKLKAGDYTKTLMSLVTRAGFQRKLKVHLGWTDTTLRLEAGEKRLELRPQHDGVAAVYIDLTPNGLRETATEVMNLKGSPQTLVDKWMKQVDDWKRRADKLAAEREAALAAESE